jgi:putative phosphoesterase
VATRVGVISDTHCPEFIQGLPQQAIEALQGVDLILHAGDINSEATLAELRSIAPVEAVRGDHDLALDGLPATRTIDVEGQRIVLIHGHRSRLIEEPQTLLWTMSLGYFRANSALPRVLRRRFPDADVVVFGHTHAPYARAHDGVLMFNPGGVHQWNATTTAARLRQRPGWFEWCWLQVARHMRVVTPASVGILEVTRDGVAPRLISLESLG